MIFESREEKDPNESAVLFRLIYHEPGNSFEDFGIVSGLYGRFVEHLRLYVDLLVDYFGVESLFCWEMPEEKRFVDLRLLCDLARSGAAKTFMGKKLRGNVGYLRPPVFRCKPFIVHK